MWSKWLSLFILHLKEINAALDINVVALKWRIRFKNVSIFAFMNGVGHVEFQCKNVRKIKKMSGDVMIILLVKVVEKKIFGSGWHYSSQNHYCNNLPTQKKNASMSLRSLIFSKVKGELKKTLHGEEKKNCHHLHSPSSCCFSISPHFVSFFHPPHLFRPLPFCLKGELQITLHHHIKEEMRGG